MADQATNPGGCGRLWLALFAVTCTSPLDLVASWTVDTSAASAHLGGPPSYTFSTLAEAQAFANANKNYGARLVPGGSDDTSSGGSGGGLGFPGLSGGSTPGLTAQQQLALSTAQAALPLLQQAVHGLLTGPPKAPTVQMPRDQSQIAAQQLYNSGLWYARQNYYANAIVEFRKALERAPGNQQILDAIANAQHQIDLAALKHSASAAPPAAPIANTAAFALNLIGENSDSSVVDLRNTTKTTVDPAYFKADSPPMPDDPLTGRAAADAQFDELYRKSILEENPHGITDQRQLDAQFDELMRQEAIDSYKNQLEQTRIDAQFDELMRQEALDGYKKQLDKLSPQDLEKMERMQPHN